jgi:hypothetical protein
VLVTRELDGVPLDLHGHGDNLIVEAPGFTGGRRPPVRLDRERVLALT